LELVHPALVVGVLAELVGVDVAAVFVEVDLAVLFAHVDLEFSGGAAALPAVVVVADAEVALADTEGEASAWGEFDVEEATERARELEKRAEAVGLLEQDGDGDEDVDRDHVFRFDPDEEPEEKLLVAEDHGDGDEESEDSGPGSDGGDVWTKAEDVSEGDGGGEDGSADDGGEVELAEPAAAEGGLEDGAGEPEGEHAEEDADEAVVDEGVGEELPDLAVGDGARFKEEMGEEDVFEARSEPVQEKEREEDAYVGEDELAGDAGEGWQAKRDGAGAGHAAFIIGQSGRGCGIGWVLGVNSSRNWFLRCEVRMMHEPGRNDDFGVGEMQGKSETQVLRLRLSR
jgi:hypothetical protein